MAAWIQATLVLAVVVGLHVPLGDYMARVLEGGGHNRAEKALYRVGRLIGSLKQGWTLLTVVGILFALLLAAGSLAQSAHTVSATGSADGAANASYDSFSRLGGGVLLAAMMLGEIAPGGTGSGLYGLIVVVLVAVFIGGLMVGRTPEYLRKRIGYAEMRWVVVYALIPPTVILACSAIALATGNAQSSMGNTGAHGLTELVYSYTSNTNSNSNSNSSVMAGFNGATDFHNLLVVVAMLAGRYLPMACVLALAGRLARQQPGVVTLGTLRAHGVNFVVLATAASVVLALLNFLPALSLGTIADGLM